ncbi:DUF2878 domain-containing protein [Shewanella youngdeokensis]|uniref:DUF2878 domain-containing protein n=1 Tax=Shewanella youngdeokensis TaxID=2999068 RepID=A0ABZ0K1M3_9GAMM|nr:DUF2878 domain-containing protein [Shewanella sp. DAU334]
MLLAAINKIRLQYVNIQNLVLYIVAWWTSVLFMNEALAYSFSLLMFHFLLSNQMLSDFIFMLKVAMIGIAVDGLLINSGVFHFSEAPYWLMLLWCHFAIALRYSFSFAQKQPVYLNAVLGGIAGCVSYLVGAYCEATRIPLGYWITGVISFCTWFVLFPIFVHASKRTVE